jgi:hypothetical protein
MATLQGAHAIRGNVPGDAFLCHSPLPMLEFETLFPHAGL